MDGTEKQQDAKSSTVVIPRNQKAPGSGTIYAMFRKVMMEGGFEKHVRVGTLFIRPSRSGGVAFVTGDDGLKYELPLFAK